MKSEEAAFLSISELVTLLNSTLERAHPRLNFEGEISKIKHHQSGHIYFDLKDGTGCVAAVIWRSGVPRIKFALKEGLAVQCRGRPNVWVGSGKLQMVVESITLAGAGLLHKKFLELKAKLEAEGLFAPERKRTLPFFPKAIGLVTSSQGAAIRDIDVKIRERMPSQLVYLADSRVQGAGAAEEIAQSIKMLSDSGLVDVIVVARGGGSLEDLWAFNEETVVRAIFASKVPVVSGVGHEEDYTLADFVADRRAPTPTAAAEMVVPKRSELLLYLSESERRLRDYERWLMPLTQKVDELAGHLESLTKLRIEDARNRLLSAQARLNSIQPGKVLETLRGKLEVLGQKLYGFGSRNIGERAARLDFIGQRGARAYVEYLNGRRHLVDRVVSRMEALDPRGVLKRGYAVVEGQAGVISSSSQIAVGEILQLRFAKGGAGAEVKTIKG
ncbi:MAG: exodeoxyribonuclease VII large subunit [Oligoflexia bacterium]|nr:exodeoxyribonuclease VII large subunit [Oligoflexia bacterium]